MSARDVVDRWRAEGLPVPDRVQVATAAMLEWGDRLRALDGKVAAVVAERDHLKAEVDRLTRQLDAVIRLCYHPSEDDRGNWYYRIDVDPADGLSPEDLGFDFIDFDTEDEARAAVLAFAAGQEGTPCTPN